VYVLHCNLTLNAAQDYVICETWLKIKKKGKIYQFNTTLFNRHVRRYVYLNFIYVFGLLNKKSSFIYTKFGLIFMCEGGAVVEWLAVDLWDTGSRPACVSTVFNR